VANKCGVVSCGNPLAEGGRGKHTPKTKVEAAECSVSDAPTCSRVKGGARGAEGGTHAGTPAIDGAMYRVTSVGDAL